VIVAGISFPRHPSPVLQDFLIPADVDSSAGIFLWSERLVICLSFSRVARKSATRTKDTGQNHNDFTSIKMLEGLLVLSKRKASSIAIESETPPY
jgi:hypothetical protein